MGFFSWITSDTKESISNSYSSRGTFTVHMITEDGQVFTEDNYEGYGTFGGKDFHVLIGELNGIKCKTKEDVRLKVIHMVYQTIITNGERSYESGGVDFFNWETPLKKEGGKTPNQLVKEKLFKRVYPNGYGDYKKMAKNGYKIPKFVTELPTKKNWKKVWDSLPYPKDCKDQGYFY